MELNLKKNWKFIIPLIIFIGFVIYFNRAKAIEALTPQEEREAQIKKMKEYFETGIKNMEALVNSKEVKDNFYLEAKLQNDAVLGNAKKAVALYKKVIIEIYIATILASVAEGKNIEEDIFIELFEKLIQKINFFEQVVKERDGGGSFFGSSDDGDEEEGSFMDF